MAFKKGESGNPRGRAVVTEQQKRVAADLLSPLVEKAVRTINAAMDSDDPAWATKLVFEYVFGKPSQSVDLTTQGNKIGILYVGTPPQPE